MPRTKTETKVIVPENTIAKVVESRNSAGELMHTKVDYQAEVEQNEVPEIDEDSENETGDLLGEDFNSEFEFENQVIPDTPLEVLFKQLRGAISNGIPDNFLAMVSRNPDPIGMRFNYGNSMPAMSLGAFGFSSRDLFNFDSAIQEKNHNSGGVFNVKIYKSDNTPLLIKRNPYAFEQRGEPNFKEVGLVNYPVPDPPKIDMLPGANGSDSALLAYIERSDKRIEDLFERMNRPQEKSEVEQLVMRTAVERLMNPQSQGGGMESFQQMMISMFAMPQMVEGFAKKMFPETPPPAEMGVMDHIGKLLENPTVADTAANVVNALTNVSADFAQSKMRGQAVTIEQNDDDDADEIIDAQPEPNPEMKQLIHNLLTELESENPLNADNVFMGTLQNHYPMQAIVIKGMCKTSDFDTVVGMLGGEMNKINPNPLIPFVDLGETEKQNKFVWNERGDRLVVRLREFYTFVRELK